MHNEETRVVATFWVDYILLLHFYFFGALDTPFACLEAEDSLFQFKEP
jgi:hypothetical protein